MPFFSKVFRGKDREGGAPKSKKHAQRNGVVPLPQPKPRWEDAWLRKDVEPEEIQELLRGCTHELKSRALDMPFLLLPFRPASDPSAARSFIRNYFNTDRQLLLQGDRLSRELLLTEPLVLCSVLKWCWSRLPGGVVTWEAYELFRVGEQDSNMAYNAFATFIPISVESDARTKIIFDFFDLMAAVAAHGKTNGMGGRKLSRLAGWWAFEQIDNNNGFDGGYKSWSRAADATSHLFFAYLRSLSPYSGRGASGISILPLSLQTLVQATEYPPNQPMSSPTSKVVMIVDSVSPTPFALLRRAKHFQYRDDDRALQDFSDYEDPVKALTDECQRVLKCISSTNQSTVSTSKASTSLPDASWSRFEDIGFSGFGDYSDQEDEVDGFALVKRRKNPPGLRSVAQSKNHDLGRPTTPSWADFLSSGFVDETNKNGPAPLLLPHDKILPPIGIERGNSSQSHEKTADDSALEPGELASIVSVHFDDAFWWVWISSLAGEETMERKAVFGRCALVETMITGGRWLIMEEIVKGAAPPPEEGAYIAEKKSRFGFSTRGRFTRTKSTSKKPPPPPKTDPYSRGNQASPLSKTSIGPDQHARIQAAAAALQEKQKQLDRETTSPRRARVEDSASVKTSSVFTLQPIIISEAAPAMRWANSYDKNAIRAAYLGNNFAGKGSSTDLSGLGGMNNAYDPNDHVTPTTRELPPRPNPNLVNGAGLRRDEFGLSGKGPADGRDLPALPSNTPSQLASMPPFAEPIITPSAPLTVAPNHEIRVSNEAATQAADVPFPAATPLENAQSMNDKPLPPAGSNFDGAVETAQHEGGSPTHEEANGVSSPPSSPESKKESRKLAKAQAQAQGGGFKHFFGKKRPGAPSPSATPQPADNSAIAAARAAYVGPQMKPNYNASQSTINRRLSTIGRKKAPMMPLSDSYGITPVRDSENHEILTPAPPVAKRFQLQNGYGSSQVSLNRVDTNQQHHVDGEFRKFDQGPMMDQPAFVPESSPEHTSPPTPLEPVQDQQSIEQNPTSGKQEHKPSSDKPIEVDDKDSIRKEINHDDSESEDERSASTVLDRWAQNRKIAEAARKKEKQPVLVDKTDDGDADGETSGEETIESRVARIKARVAELTGGQRMGQ